MTPLVEKRTVDMQIIGEWVTPGSRVLDLGCGRGALLDYLVQTKEVAALGVDLDFARVTAGVARGLSIY
ncbi:MAG: methionine biosynthesis protein MetW, partial [Planctomycetota bacterium]